MSSDEREATRPACSLLLFVATSTEENSLARAAKSRDIPYEKIRDAKLGEYRWLGVVGNETVIAVPPVREGGRVVMGALGPLGSAARAVRFREATGAQAIVQLGMAFGIDRVAQQHGDVLVSSSLVPYDNRDVKPASRGWCDRLFHRHERYLVDYSQASRHPARSALVQLFLRQQRRGGHSFGVHVGAILSGAARIHSGRFRDELVTGVPGGEDPIVGGEMEGVGLLAASTATDDPVWCVAKGISDFADQNRDSEIKEFRGVAGQNAAEFVLAALVNDAAQQ